MSVLEHIIYVEIWEVKVLNRNESNLIHDFHLLHRSYGSKMKQEFCKTTYLFIEKLFYRIRVHIFQYPVRLHAACHIILTISNFVN